MSSQEVSTAAVPTQGQEGESKQVNVVDVEVTNENVALNVMVAMLNMAQRRGVFTMQESAKAWECVSKFMRPTASTGSTAEDEAKNVTMQVSESK
jgi:hypothetical protein|tara:strand:+ start:803 stop:1087 length:285 start_codon:yes stop_codon:yes gene_type:complete